MTSSTRPHACRARRPSTGSSSTRRPTGPRAQRSTTRSRHPSRRRARSEPIPVWTAVAARARFGVDVAHEARSELVGRERELSVVRDAFERARHERTPQLLTLVGVPGIGKSRLVYELQRIVDADPELITWRQGRCLAYGDGITLWALGEIVKAQAGVLEQDTLKDIATKVHQVVEDTLAGSGDETRVEAHLLALLGSRRRHTARRRSPKRRIRGLAPLSRGSRRAASARRRRRGHPLGGREPPRLPRRARRLGDGRPAARRRDGAARAPRAPSELGRRQAERHDARALPAVRRADRRADRAPARPTAARCRRPADAARAGGRQSALRRAVRRAVHGTGLDRGARASGDAPGHHRRASRRAARLGEEPAAGRGRRRQGLLGEFDRPRPRMRRPGRSTHSSARVSSAASAARHSKARASSRSRTRSFATSRTARSHVPIARRRHRAVAEWIDGLGRPEDHAEMLAYHWSSALELVRASGGSDDEIVERTRVALRAAGDRASSLNSYAVAAAQYDDALALWPDDAERPDLLFRLAVALHRSYNARASRMHSRPRETHCWRSATRSAHPRRSRSSRASSGSGVEHDLVCEHLARAEALAGDSVSAAAARVLAFAGRIREIAGEHDEGRRLAEAAFATATELGLDELRAHALTTIGMAKNDVDLGSGDRRHGARPRDRARGRRPGRLGDRQQPRRLLDFCGRLSTHRRALRRGDCASASGTETPRASASSAATASGSTSCSGAGTARSSPRTTFIAECEAGSPHTLEYLAREVAFGTLARPRRSGRCTSRPAPVVRARADEARAIPQARLARR